MSSAATQSRFDGFQPPVPQSCGPYEHSIASSASSSQDSIFSDPTSTQSSIASSISDDFRPSQEDSRHRWLPQVADPSYGLAQEQHRSQCLLSAQQPSQVPSYADVTSVPSEQPQHPRRSSWERKQKPPPLVRQCERKINFVDNLVVVPCRSEGSKRGVLPLRIYIEETLRRSRTSYSTLQVALYYLVLIKAFVPKNDFTMEQEMDCPASRAVMCGRRMFLSALILASKYLQDRNYSAKAWSKMSGLPVNEINTNERTFLGKVCWKLHIPEPIFKRWTDVVLNYTPSLHPPSPGQPGFGITWAGIVPLLTPELDRVPFSETLTPPDLQCPANYGLSPPSTPTPTRSAINPMLLASTSQEGTPTPLTVLPRFLEPALDIAPPTPALARMGPLPTPQMTPSTYGPSTPAASVFGSRRPSICSAMAFAQKANLTRCTLDSYPGALPRLDRFYQPASRRPSVSTASSGSSPESMISDHTRSSRASSISSISTVSTTSSTAPQQRACLARQATCRSAGQRLPVLPAMLLARRDEGGGGGAKAGASAVKPILIADDTDMLTSSPETLDFSVSEKAMHAPHRHSKHAPHSHHHAATGGMPPTTSSSSGFGAEKEKCRKRARPRGGRRSELQDEIRFQLEEGLDGMHMDVDVDGEFGGGVGGAGGEGGVGVSAAAGYAVRMLAREYSHSHSHLHSHSHSDSLGGVVQKEAQPAAALLSVAARRESGALQQRVPMQKMEGKKRACCSVAAAGVTASTTGLWGEVN
ncbi:PHO85 cyclin-5 [Friedmanniomyces endolithicus]|uniref:PHO85 cyclin-5 n=1 Tax=Friedmanniomyces endolithicus TaxID=329885 RepID=A0AAN6KG40_9PEZI|nr:PHO85 cyclin-5 [Friedmanniomyces endolithicus]KAK0953370.1 PHO85 cyclin-5 [Friedmanniomyces endolithicus]KAK0981123.1 PHO85 cyclin-5 [Friedmanniomyces endolithicus]KAK1021969.1 PHO85 cyclin-5 [Friedmanniomyces endolithicus]